MAPAQLTEHEPVQVTWQVEPDLHETLPLGPTVGEQVAPVPQSRLQELPQVPSQVLISAQLSVQLPPSTPQLVSLNRQESPVPQLQLAPVQASGFGGLVEQADDAKRREKKTARTKRRRIDRMVMVRSR